MQRMTSTNSFVHLRTLQAVLESGSHSAAAKELGYTTSAVSQQIAALEKALGVALFERGPRNLWPTPAGLAMAKHAQVLLKQLAQAEDDMQSYAHGARGRLRIGASGTVAAQLLPKAISRLLDKQPETELLVEDLESADLPNAILSGEVDLGIVYEYAVLSVDRHPELKYRLVLDEELVILQGVPNIVKDERIPLESLAEEVWATSATGSDGEQVLGILCAEAGFAPRIRFNSKDFDVIRGLVSEQLAVALVPALALGIDRNIRMHRLVGDPPRRRIYAVRRASDTNPVLPEMLQALDAAAATFLEWTTTAFLTRLDSPLATSRG
ncbi:DNA-binding transcriptional regulator, LysR family [Arthrobacter crystallopoietes]|uniref:DNA-binding transcriptional regulator, LysR family n=2 Tax=Crystallibacter crystallopoietes TaxID=37928 RepID=A0A1H0ZLB6_9MICC|nr:hypothetical protein AC20117_15100 [Arthrobacter crystallopoietes]SDQ28298.1 DNA-binding transcriptional regulator, LysR family [Arthrobacter crystallopoietes]